MGAVTFMKEYRNDSFDFRDYFTERQKKILDGEIDLAKVRFNELTTILQKAEDIDDKEVCERVKLMYDWKKFLDKFPPSCSIEEAMNTVPMPWVFHGAEEKKEEENT